MSGTDEFFSDDRTGGYDGTLELSGEGYESFLFDRNDPLLARYRGMRYDDYARERTSPAFVQELLADWERLYQEPFRGVTTDGRVLSGLYELPAEQLAASGAAVAAMRALDAVDDDERALFEHPIDAREWRAWSNPEFVIHPVGVRLEDLGDAATEAIFAMIRAPLSAEGYSLVRELMDLNGFLGRLTDLPTLMNRLSYSVALFGTPSDTAPWGWQLFGHHVAVNFLSVAGRHVIAPVFLGAEPAVSIDGRPTVFADRVTTAIALASSLTPTQRNQAVVYASVLDPSMPGGRLHPADERHVAGAFRDNRMIPYEGVSAAGLSDTQWARLRELVADFLVLLAEPQRALTLADIDAHRSETYFAWYGATDGSQPFYFRIQSPVVLAELDHHAGVWLTNQLPERFHIHTTLRLPNGNDYGRAYIDEWRSREVPRATEPAADDKWVH